MMQVFISFGDEEIPIRVKNPSTEKQEQEKMDQNDNIKEERAKMEYTITVYDATEILPSRSGNYLARTVSSHWTELPYSERHKLFNVYDSDESLDNAIGVDFWTVMPKIEREVK